MGSDQFIAARVSSEMKARLKAVAAREHLSESALLKRLIDRALPPTSDTSDVLMRAEDSQPRDRRLSIRLRPDDLLLLRARAEARGMASSTYVSVLVRAHLHSLAPLPREELLALKRSIAELTAIGRHLNQIARVLNQEGRAPPPGRQELQAMLRVAEGLRDHFKGVLQANIRSWTRGYTDESR